MAASREVQGIVSFLVNTGAAFKVTDISTPGIHVAGSWHYREGTGGTGLAVDLAGPLPSLNSPELLAIFARFRPVESKLAELIYSGAPYSIKNGIRVPRYAVASHWNHVHVAVPKGVFLAMPDDPNLPNIVAPVGFFPIVSSDGRCTGYYVFSFTTGEVHGHGPGAPYHGRSEVVAP